MQPVIAAQMQAQTGAVLKLDHTFWGAKFARNDQEQEFSSILTIMNEKSQLFGLYFCTSKSLLEVKEELISIARRY